MAQATAPILDYTMADEPGCPHSRRELEGIAAGVLTRPDISQVSRPACRLCASSNQVLAFSALGLLDFDFLLLLRCFFRLW